MFCADNDKTFVIDIGLSVSMMVFYSRVLWICNDIKTKYTPIMISFRDIKTKNILVKRDGSCAIADFGLAVR